MKKLPVKILSFLCLAFIMNSCLNEDLLNKVESHEHNYKLETVSIDKVPFLNPVVEKFAKKNKSINKFARESSRFESFAHLILDLDKILVYYPNEGLVSYSIVIKNEIDKDSPYFFENLHVVEKGDSLQSFIYRWLPDNKDIPFDLKTFSGVVENYETDYTLKSMSIYQNGMMLDTSTPIPDGASSSYVNAECQNIIYCSCNFIPYNCFCFQCAAYVVLADCSTGGGGGTSSGSSGTGSSGTGNSGSGSGSGSGSNSGLGSSGNSNSLGLDPDSVVVVPNPLEYEEYEGFMYDNFLNPLETENSDLYYWLKNPYPMGAPEEIKNLIKDYVNSDNADLGFARDLALLAKEEANQQDAIKLVSLSVKTKMHGLDNSLDIDYLNQIDSDIDLDLSSLDAEKQDVFLLRLQIRYRILKTLNPSWNEATLIWETLKDVIHLGLDVVGLVPLLGEPADLINGVLYALEGDKLNSGLSFASALPIVGFGSAATKFGLRAKNYFNVATNIASKEVLIWKVTANLITFGDRAQLRKVLGLGSFASNGQHAHHLIPWDFCNSAIVQKAAKSGDAWHMNDIINGIPLPSTNHLTGHNLYNNKIGQKLTQLNAISNTPQEAYVNLVNFTNQVKTLIQNNPNMNLGQIANLIN
ncbi:AHH domain-containing protein [Flavobacterium sp.]|uniref:AHH domain-containing protein n=1 Tax=Flavobacterium sp. TaxID=239 RepID=UPI002606E8B8|nr:AHH domain-containing protein [Flavobacterium sp.]MDD2985193.1 AHH domain-containing protein [Flavobacterium sp.]